MRKPKLAQYLVLLPNDCDCPSFDMRKKPVRERSVGGSKAQPPGTPQVARTAQIHEQLAQAIAWHQQGRLQQAQASYLDILKREAKCADALHLLGVIEHQLGNDRNAVEFIRKAIEIDAHQSAYHSNLGIALAELKLYDSAISSYDQAISIRSDFAEAYSNRGNAQKELKRFDAAIGSYDLAIRLQPDFADAYCNRGNALRGIKQYRVAIADCDKANRIKPDCAEAYSIRGNALLELKQYQAAIASYDCAIVLKPDYPNSYSNRGSALLEMMQYERARSDCARAIGIRPDFAEAYSNRGNLHKELEQYDAAIASYNAAIQLQPDLAEAYSNRGNVQLKLKQHDATIASCDRVIQLNAEYDYVDGLRLHSKMAICDWRDHGRELGELVHRIQAGGRASSPFQVLALTTSLPLQQMVAAIYAQDKHPTNLALGDIARRREQRRIRIGYYSADFHNHATACLMAELFEKHDKTQFELFAFSFGPDANDEMRLRLLAAFDRFVDVKNLSDQGIAQLSRDLEIDIAVDLKGYTTDERAGIFSYRAAPIQVNYLGYPGTMAADYMDYLIADRTVIPVESQKYYSEKVAYLPHSYQVNDTQRTIADRAYSRAELGLPEEGFIFCCFNNNYKITPDVFECWMRIMLRLDGSVLWLLQDNPRAALNLAAEAERWGVDRGRLIFAERMPLAEHLARHRVADLFLDTLPYNAHTTASDALWAGLPVLTCMGESFASRVAASLLRAIELPELITTSLGDYESLAIELATHTAELRTIREKLARNRHSTELFDIQLFTRHIEDAYRQMHERYRADLPAEAIHVGAEKTLDRQI